MGKSKAWFFKWLDRYKTGEENWYTDRQRTPKQVSGKTSSEMEEIIKLTRQSLYNEDVFCGAQAIHWELTELGVRELPSLRTINRIISRNDLTHRRSGRYEPKGVSYPQFNTNIPNHRHQLDFVGPRHLRINGGKALRFYSLNVVDLATGRCGVQPIYSKSGDAVYGAIWAIWKRLGMPRHLQVDNEFAFYGSPTHPRGMGPLIRLCLKYGIELWFIPPSEPWRNSVVEQFNNHLQQKFLDRIVMENKEKLMEGALKYEYKHNSRYRYSKLGGKTPLATLENYNGLNLLFPNPEEPIPAVPLTKSKTGRYHLIRHIRGDGVLNVFGEKFKLPPELHYEYVVATVDVEQQRLLIFHDQRQKLDFEYKLR